MRRALAVLAGVVLLAACSSGGSSEAEPPCTIPTDTAGALGFIDLSCDGGTVQTLPTGSPAAQCLRKLELGLTIDSCQSAGNAEARFVRRVDTELRSHYSPIAYSDYTALRYGRRVCDDPSTARPKLWADPGGSEAELRRFVDAVRRVAQAELC